MTSRWAPSFVPTSGITGIVCSSDRAAGITGTLCRTPRPYQDPNLWPDKRPTYFFGQLVMPAGSSLTIHGRFPHARYFKFNFYKFELSTFVAVPGAALAGYDIEPDPGSGNPFKVGADRQVKNRNFAVNVLAEEPPAHPAELPKNTIYVGRGEKELMAGFRIYVSDKGYDGAGWGLRTRLRSTDPASPAKGSSLTALGSRTRKSLSNSVGRWVRRRLR